MLGRDERHTRVKLPDGKVRKFPSGCFAPAPPPRLLGWKFDDQIVAPDCDHVDVTFELDTGKRWLAFTTPGWLNRQLAQCGALYWVQANLVIVTEISEATVSNCLRHLLEQGELLEHSRPLDEPDELD